MSTTKVVPGLLLATASVDKAAVEAAARMARHIRDALKARGRAAIALSGGSSPVGAYRLLAKDTLDWTKIDVFWVDERCVPANHDRSNYRAAKEALLDPAGVPPPNVHRMRGEASDPTIAAADYDATLREVVTSKIGGIPSLDLVVLGVGDDGHTASLFPGEATTQITDRLVAAVPARADREARLTLTVPVLENARATVLVAVGANKHPALERVWAANGSLDETPARVIRGFRGSITWVIDRAAGGM